MEGFTTMNRWMKRRIERSRERCDQAKKRPQTDTDLHKSDEEANKDLQTAQPVR